MHYEEFPEEILRETYGPATFVLVVSKGWFPETKDGFGWTAKLSVTVENEVVASAELSSEDEGAAYEMDHWDATDWQNEIEAVLENWKDSGWDTRGELDEDWGC